MVGPIPPPPHAMAPWGPYHVASPSPAVQGHGVGLVCILHVVEHALSGVSLQDVLLTVYACPRRVSSSRSPAWSFSACPLTSGSHPTHPIPQPSPGIAPLVSVRGCASVVALHFYPSLSSCSRLFVLQHFCQLGCWLSSLHPHQCLVWLPIHYLVQAEQ